MKNKLLIAIIGTFLILIFNFILAYMGNPSSIWFFSLFGIYP